MNEFFITLTNFVKFKLSKVIKLIWFLSKLFIFISFKKTNEESRINFQTLDIEKKVFYKFLTTEEPEKFWDLDECC